MIHHLHHLNLLNNYFNIIDSSLELIPENIDLPVNYSNYLYVIDLPIHFNKVTIPETDELIEVNILKQLLFKKLL